MYPHFRSVGLVCALLVVGALLGGCDKFSGENDVDPARDTAEQDSSVGQQDQDKLPATAEKDSAQKIDTRNDRKQTSKADLDANRVKKWRVVISSQPSEGRAEKFISRQGVETAEILYVDYLDTYRVVYASFDQLNEAQSKFGEVQSQFPEAWLVLY